MSVPTSETSLAFTAVDFGGKYMQELGQVRVWAGPTVPTEGLDTCLEVLEGLLGRQGLALAHCGSKETDRGVHRKIFLLLLFLFCFILFSCWGFCFYNFFIFYFYFLFYFLIYILFFYFTFCHFVIFFCFHPLYFFLLCVYFMFSLLFFKTTLLE